MLKAKVKVLSDNGVGVGIVSVIVIVCIIDVICSDNILVGKKTNP